MIVTDCTRFVERVSFWERQRPTANAGFIRDAFFTQMGTTAERLELRNYIKSNASPLYYTGACLPPALVKPIADSVTVQELSFPALKAETKITGCDVDAMRISPQGELSPVVQRWQDTVNRHIADLMEARMTTLNAEAIALCKYGAYTLHSSPTENVGLIDYNRADELRSIDLTGTNDDFSSQCAKPIRVIEEILRNMAKYGGVAGQIDVIWGDAAWRMMEAHEERDGIKYSDRPDLVSGLNSQLFFGYSDVQFRGASNGGQLRHWTSYAQYVDHTGSLVPMIAPGEILIMSNAGFGGKMIYRTISPDGKEILPAGMPFWLHDDPELEYERKCRSFNPWIEDYHIFVPTNVNGAALVRVTDDDADVCVPCETCA